AENKWFKHISYFAPEKIFFITDFYGKDLSIIVLKYLCQSDFTYSSLDFSLRISFNFLMWRHPSEDKSRCGNESIEKIIILRKS
uniref:Uncharacterized protein n=1 Tax=Strigamia maritima TaxID=126957 RepID=T1J4U5_STRMM